MEPIDPAKARTASSQNVKPYDGKTVLYAPRPYDPEAVDEAQMDRFRIRAHHKRSPEADMYRLLRTKVLQIMQRAGYRTLAITSPRYGDGKTTIAINLGIGIALDLNQTVLMADLDLRKPSLAPYLGLPPGTGLSDHLLNNVPVAECLTRLPFERIAVLSAGTPIDHSSEMLGSPKMAALAAELKGRYNDRIIIYDMPPALEQDDPIAFLPQVDAVLVVVRDGVTRIDDLKRCLHSLAGANIIGTVLNACW